MTNDCEKQKEKHMEKGFKDNCPCTCLFFQVLHFTTTSTQLHIFSKLFNLLDFGGGRVWNFQRNVAGLEKAFPLQPVAEKAWLRPRANQY